MHSEVVGHFRPALASILSYQNDRATEGWLTKEGGTHKNWRTRWFVLRYVGLRASFRRFCYMLTLHTARTWAL